MNTNWTNATKDPFEALVSLMHSLKSGHNAWLELMDNKNPAINFPVTVPNPALNDINSWEMSYGLPAGSTKKDKYFNSTEKDLVENYTVAFSSRDAHDAYVKSRKCILGLFAGMGKQTSVHIDDANKHRSKWTDIPWKYKGCEYAFKPKKDVPYNIPSEGNVFVVCCGDEHHLSYSETLVKARDLISTLIG